MKKASMKMAILIPSLAVLVAGIIAMVAVVGILSSNSTNNLTNRLLDARVNQYANEFRSFSEDVYGSIMTITPLISNFTDPEFVADVADPRGEVIGILSTALSANDKIVSMWTCWEPNAFDGKDREYAGAAFYDATGRFAPNVYKNGNNIEVAAIAGYDDPIEGEFYQGPRSTGKPYVTDPYTYDFGGQETFIYTIAIPILKDGKVVGVVGTDINLQGAINVMNSGSILDDGYLYTLSPSGLISTHSNSDLLLKHYSTTWMENYSAQVEAVIANGGSFSVNAYSDITKSNMTFLGYGVMIGDTGRYWVVCGVVPEATVNASSTALVWAIVAIGVALIVVVGVTIFFIVRDRLRRLPALTATAEAIAAGDIDTTSFDTGTEATKNEISLLSQALSKMMNGIRQQASVLDSVANGDFTITIPVRSKQDMMNKAINSMLSSNSDVMKDIRTAASQVASGATQIAQASQNLATGSSQQSASIEELSASLAEVQDKTNQNAKDSASAREANNKTTKSLDESILSMGQMLEAMKAIDESSSNITRVIKVIDDIAFQTNILALNAAVEAARAGQHGKGFAVVADEVRNLAAKSAEAAKETSSLIEGSTARVREGNEIVAKTNANLETAVVSAKESTQLIEQVATASIEQAKAISEINQGMNQISTVVQANSATAEESAAASEEMSAQAVVMNEIVAKFKLNQSGSNSFGTTEQYGMSEYEASGGYATAGGKY